MARDISEFLSRKKSTPEVEVAEEWEEIEKLYERK